MKMECRLNKDFVFQAVVEKIQRDFGIIVNKSTLSTYDEEGEYEEAVFAGIECYVNSEDFKKITNKT